MKNKLYILGVVSLIVASFVDPSWSAFGGGEQKVVSFFDRTASFVTLVGTSIFVIFLGIASFKYFSGDGDAFDRLKSVLIGGAILGLAKPIIDIIQKFAGN